ncbi:cytochrome P450 [Martensiomyces pterosporus]|nr:cytochrome P450 [Martensiomyces pterosporus]
MCTVFAAHIAWRTIYALYFLPLRNIPGQFFSRISNYEKYGNMSIVTNKMVAVCDPNDCRLILATHAFRKDMLYAHVDFIEPNMLLTGDPGLNKQRRRQVGPALSLASLRKMEPTILAAGIQQLLDKWDSAIEQSSTGKAKVCYEKDFVMMTFDVIGSLGFGRTQRLLTAGDLTVVRWKTNSLMLVQVVAGELKWLPFSYLLTKSLRKDVEEFIAFANQSIEERKQLVAEGAAKPSDILQAYIDAEDPESRTRMTPSQVTAEVIMTLRAGAGTTSDTLTWTIHLLMLHPQHYKRSVDEVRSNFDKDHLITFDEVKERLPFLEACVYESMRTRPVSSFLPRIVPPGGVTLQGHFIPEGYTCIPLISAANMNMDAWDEPHTFNPERNLAWVEMLTTLANLFNAYDFALPEDALFTQDNLDKYGQPVIMPQKMIFTNGPRFPERDCQVVISKRQK